MLKLFTHTDLDGIGCALVAYDLLGKDAVHVEFCENSEVDRRVTAFLDSSETSNYDEIIISDLSVSDRVAQRIDNMIKSSELTYHVALLDHHITALPLNKYEWCRVNEHYPSLPWKDGVVKSCGTMMVCDKLASNPTYIRSNCEALLEKNYLWQFVNLVRSWDTWDWKGDAVNGDSAKKLNDLFHIRGRDKFIEETLQKFESKNKFELFSNEDELLLEQRDVEINRYIAQKDSQMRKIITQWGIAGYVFAEQYVSQLGNQLCILHPDIKFSIMVDMSCNSISLRSAENGADVSEIAKHFGGGGHKHAAGFNFDKGLYSKVLGVILGDEF